ncbi:MAG: glycosyltransferase [Microcoleaceae cyanobacterium]
MKESSQKKPIFFYCFSPDGSDSYQHPIVCLAEGLKALGIEFYSNINYWQISADSEEYLFRHDPTIGPDDCSIVVMENNWFIHGKPFPDHLFHAKRKYRTVYFEHAAASRYSWESQYRQFDFIFRAHYNQRCRYPTNVYPWAFGLSERVIDQTHLLPEFSDRNQTLLVNFRIHNHPLRTLISRKFFPEIEQILPIDQATDSLDSFPTGSNDYLQWVQTGKRHYPSYYERLKHSVACACFGGLLMNSWPPDPYAYDLKPQRPLWQRAINRTINSLDPRPPRVLSWESYRFWESLAAGCVPIHIDFEKYGICLPVMPENWRHYIGIDIDNIEAAITKIKDEPQLLETISTKGRRWALEHYDPKETARRFLQTVG